MALSVSRIGLFAALWVGLFVALCVSRIGLFVGLLGGLACL